MVYTLTTLLTGGGKMPDIFKALASIQAWAFFIIAWVMGLSVLVTGLITGRLLGPEPPPMVMLGFFALAFTYAIGAVVVMRLRQKME